MKKIAIGLALLLCAVSVPARANPALCLNPDQYGPIIYDFTFGSSLDPTNTSSALNPGTFVQIYADDTPEYTYEGPNFANYIERVDVLVDLATSYRMTPLENRPKPRDFYHHTFSATQLGPGFHTLRFIARDVCDLEDFRDFDIFVVAPGVVVSCHYPLEAIC